MTVPNNSIQRKVCVVTTTRADWGLLMPLARELKAIAEIELQIIASNMHLLPQFGMTVNEIEADGFNVNWKVDMAVDGDNDYSRAKAMARCADGMADAFASLRPDAAILLGDRYEMLAVAAVAATMHIPIIHIAGGEISEGALDDCFRHAITKLASLHLTSTETYRQRVIQMGETPATVVNTGAIGVWNAMNIEPMSREELSKSLGFNLDGTLALVTYHPATNDTSASAGERTDALIEALSRFDGIKYVVTYPNNDSHSLEIVERLQAFALKNPERVKLVKSLGMLRYQSMLRIASVVIGNSSSGIVEVPSAGIPTVDIGIRQRGRMAAPSVIHCGDSADDISSAISKALGNEMQMMAQRRENPYYKADTPALMRDAVLDFVLNGRGFGCKKFYDIKLPKHI